MDTTKLWDYRVVRKESKDGSDEWYSIQEIYYDDDGQPMAQTIDLQIEGDTIIGMRTQLELMLKSLEEPVLDESDIISSPPVLEKIGEDGRGNDLYIYESPDGGETIYRKKVSEDEREEMIRAQLKAKKSWEELKAKKSWVCQICGKSTYDVDCDYIGSGTNHLGCELEIEMGEKDDKTLYEDMGDGHLIKVSVIKKIKENLKNLRTGKKPPTEKGL